jgi:hypothetical protein
VHVFLTLHGEQKIGGVHFLTKKGADINAKPAVWDGRTALEAAAHNRHKSGGKIIIAEVG